MVRSARRRSSRCIGIERPAGPVRLRMTDVDASIVPLIPTPINRRRAAVPRRGPPAGRGRPRGEGDTSTAAAAAADDADEACRIDAVHIDIGRRWTESPTNWTRQAPTRRPYTYSSPPPPPP